MASQTTSALRLYQDTLVALNSFGSPVFDEDDFNTHFAQAMQQVLNRFWERYETRQGNLDAIRMLRRRATLEVNRAADPAPTVPPATPVPLVEKRSVPLPGPVPAVSDPPATVPDKWNLDAYWHLTLCSVTLRHRTKKTIVDPKAAGWATAPYLTVRGECKRLSDDAEGFARNNGYYMPAPDSDSLYFEEFSDELLLVWDTPRTPDADYVLQSVELGYVAEFKPVQLSLDGQFASLQDSPFPYWMNREFVNECCRLFLEETTRGNRLDTQPKITQSLSNP